MKKDFHFLSLRILLRVNVMFQIFSDLTYVVTEKHGSYRQDVPVRKPIQDLCKCGKETVQMDSHGAVGSSPGKDNNKICIF